MRIEELINENLHTERLELRRIETRDSDALSKWISDSEMYTYWGQSPRECELNPDEYFEKGIEEGSVQLGVELKETGEVIGEVFVYDIEDERIAMIGYRIGKPWQGRGFAVEASMAVIDWLFENTQLDRLQTFVDIRNIASCRVIEKCGFTKEGTVRHGKMIDVYCDYNIYGLLREDRINSK